MRDLKHYSLMCFLCCYYYYCVRFKSDLGSPINILALTKIKWKFRHKLHSKSGVYDVRHQRGFFLCVVWQSDERISEMLLMIYNLSVAYIYRKSPALNQSVFFVCASSGIFKCKDKSLMTVI